MKKSIFLFLLAGSGFLLSKCASDKKPEEKQKEEYNVSAEQGPDSLCIANPSWFPHSQTPAPEEGKGSPFDVSSTTNQIFHQWSWQKFLWLTKPDAGGNPLFLNPAEAKQVTTFMAPVTVPAGTTVVLQDINQAGGGPPILQTNAAYGSSQTVYYSIHMNPTMYDAGMAFAKQIAGGTLPVNNEAVFPVGSFELKVAWVPVAAIAPEKLPMYFVTTASLSADGGKTFNNTKVALIGMHVVGVVENHPEFIWATFEHEDLSPDYDWTANSASSATDQLVFTKGSVSGIDGIRFNRSTKLGYTPYQVFDLFQYGVPRDSGGSFMQTSQAEPINFNNVDGINKCVQGQLDDVWKNYFYNGSIWLNMDELTAEQQAHLIDSLGNGNSTSSVKPGAFARGSSNCANVSMESFTQTFQPNIAAINVGNLANCFTCHNATSFSVKGTSPLYLSHTFQDYLGTVKGATMQAVESLKAKDDEATIKVEEAK
jgi:hypothetical protein